MLPKTIEYTDYNGNTRREVFYFHLSQAEIAEMELGTTGGLSEVMKKVIETQDTPSIIKIFKSLILKAYGVKSDDGRRFMKSEELSKEFSETEAYSKLFMELASDDKKAAEFVNGILPADLAEKVAQQTANNPDIVALTSTTTND